MGRKKKEFNKDGIFQFRFRSLCYESGKTQEQLSKRLGVSRPTVSGWLDGKNLPDIESLERIAKLFDVSADYLLGLSNTMSADVSLKAAVEYTGLSEEAVEALHIGINASRCKDERLREELRLQNLSTASELIRSDAFTKMVYNLNEILEAAYTEKILSILQDHYSECDSPEDDSEFRYLSQENRNIVASNLIHVLETLQYYPDESIPDKINSLTDEEMAMYVINAYMGSEQGNELHQFHAAKAFTGYIDQLVKDSYKKAEQRFMGL